MARTHGKAETEGGDREARTVRAAENQSLFRSVNERIEDLNEELAPGRLSQWVCECADTACTERISMTVGEYRHLRADGNRFAVARGHEKPDVERVVEATERYVVVTKFEPGGERARRLDPRSDEA